MDMARISATSDIVFKYLFGSRSSTGLLLSFINIVQRHAGMEPFTALEIVNPLGEREYASAKQTVIDIKARAADGRLVNVEVQVRTQAEYGERSLYYWAKSYTEQLLEGQEYRRLMPVVSVSILNFNLFPDKVPFRSTFQLTEMTHPDVLLTDDCVMHYLELPKLPENDHSELVEWLYALKHLDEREGPMMVLLKKNHSLQELAERYHRFEKDSEARMAYDDRMKFLHDQASLIGQAKREGLEEGREEGWREGLQEGLQEGRQVGLAEGARQKALEIARGLLSSGLPRDQIAALTNLDEEDLSGLPTA